MKMFLAILCLFALFHFSVVLAKCGNVTAIFTFGDSIVDPGNNNYLMNVVFTIARANHTPYGCDYDNQISSGRFTNSFVLPDLVAQHCGITRQLPFLHPNATGNSLTQGVNFASGGAAILDNVSANLTPFNWTQQIIWFRNVIQRLQALEGVIATKTRISNALYLISFGSNDFSQKPLSIYAGLSDSQYRTLLISTMSSRIQDLYNIGGRKFVVSAVGPLGCTPVAITLQCFSTFTFPCDRTVCNQNSNAQAYAFNIDLQNLLASLTQTLTGIKFYFSFDAYNITLDAIKNPANYGFTEVNRGCCATGTTEIGDGCFGNFVCPDRSKYLFFDATHPGLELIKILANRLYPFIN